MWVWTGVAKFNRLYALYTCICIACAASQRTRRCFCALSLVLLLKKYLSQPACSTLEEMYSRFCSATGIKQKEGQASISAIEDAQQSKILSDGTKLAFWTFGSGPRLVVVCNGLGARAIHWTVLCRLLLGTGDYTVVIWEYRGFFGSGGTRVPANTVELFVSDLKELVEHIKPPEAKGSPAPIDTLVCWSIGVQIGLQFTASHPDLVAHMVLISGLHGHVLDTAGQALHPLSVKVGRFANQLLTSLLSRERMGVLKTVEAMLCSEANEPTVRRLLAPMGFLLGSPWAHTLLVEYVRGSSTHDMNTLALVRDLQLHSVRDKLPGLKQPTLVITGGLLDLQTPSHLSLEIAEALPHAEMKIWYSGTHLLLMECPDAVLTAAFEFIQSKAKAQ
jgi:pimeloyl-ACP methyl ester carboxylesterase